jgi:predicted O-methyltransferase YrrM
VAEGGTAAYATERDLPGPVVAAVRAAMDAGFEQSCRPEQGRLLRLLAAGCGAGVIGETGTGCGVGLAWLAAGAGDGTRLVSVERDEERARVARRVHVEDPRVAVIAGDWRALLDHAPFDLLVLDGGGSGKTDDDPVDVAAALAFGGTVVIDDFTPYEDWPPTHLGAPDLARRHWLEHPALVASELRLAPDLATIVGRRVR